MVTIKSVVVPTNDVGTKMVVAVVDSTDVIESAGVDPMVVNTFIVLDSLVVSDSVKSLVDCTKDVVSLEVMGSAVIAPSVVNLFVVAVGLSGVADSEVDATGAEVVDSKVVMISVVLASSVVTCFVVDGSDVIRPSVVA